MTYISDEGDALFVHAQAQLAFEENYLSEHQDELDPEDVEDEEDFVDLAPLYVQDEDNVGEVAFV